MNLELYFLYAVLLYCISPNVRDIWGSTERQSVSHFLNGMGKNLYSTKPPNWDDETRSMLSKTIRKTIPVNNDVAAKNLKRSFEAGSSTSLQTENNIIKGKSKRMKLLSSTINLCD